MLVFVMGVLRQACVATPGTFDWAVDRPLLVPSFTAVGVLQLEWDSRSTATCSQRLRLLVSSTSPEPIVALPGGSTSAELQARHRCAAHDRAT